MRPLGVGLVACLLLGAVSQRPVEPFVPVGVAFPDVPSEWQLLRDRGFNTITAVLRWADGEPERGQYQLDRLERTLERASAAGVRVVIKLDTNAAPGWVLAQYPDGRLAVGGQQSSRVCLDHPAIREAATQFVRGVVETASQRAAWIGVDVGSDPQAGFCSCPHTGRRHEEWASRFRLSDRAALVRAARREDLQALVQATARRGPRLLISHAGVASILQPSAKSWPAQDDWHMAQAVDLYGGFVKSESVALTVDGIFAATRGKGWSMAADRSVTASDARLLAWASVSRGARALTFTDQWRDGPVFAGVLTRNPALFTELHPRPAQVAIVFDPLSGTTAAAEVHRAFLERNVAVEFVHREEDGQAGKQYSLVVRLDNRDAGVQARDALAAYEAAGLKPDVRIEGATGLVETRFLESSNVLMLIGLNYSDTSQRVTMTFSPETQEAIWQNMETGAGVNFIAGPDGPIYSYWFRPRDALVLMIRKDVR